jgi:AAA15 family ATPase/GTPase
MLIRFSIENYLSFGKSAEFTAQATREMHHRDRTFKSPIAGLRLLPISAIYGPNAAGKSNLVKALRVVQELVIDGTRPGQDIPVHPFRLDDARIGQPSRFRVEFLADDKAFAYQFAATSREVVEESLHELRPTTSRLVFSRPPAGSECPYQFGPASGTEGDAKEQQFLEFVGKGTRGNQLFLHEALDRDVKQLGPVLAWFARTLMLIGPRSTPQVLALKMHLREEFRTFCNRVIRRLGAGIDDLGTELLSLENVPLSDDQKEKLRKEVTETTSALIVGPDGQRYSALMQDGEIRIAKLVSFHRSRKGDPVRFEIPEESDGTQRFIDLLPALYELGASSYGKVVFIDELDHSLHTLLTRTLLESYLDARDEKARSQLFFTTHDATLLDEDLFRRDEVTLVEKNDDGETEIKALSDYSVRSDKRLMKDYLLGRYGGIPETRTLQLHGRSHGAADKAPAK